MDILTRKMAFVERFLNINDDDLITRLEQVIMSEKVKNYESRLKPMSMEEFHKMVDKAVNDHEKGNVISHQALLEKIKSWK